MSSRSKSRSGKSQAVEPSLFVLHYKARRVLIELPEDYDLLQRSIRRHFPKIPVNHRVSYHTNTLPICEGALTEISADFWGTIIPLLNSMTVLSEPTVELSTVARKRDLDGGNGMGILHSQPPAKKLRSHAQQTLTKASSPPPSYQVRRNMFLNIDTRGQQLQVKCHSSMSIYDILAEIPFKSKYHDFFVLNDYRIFYHRNHLSEEECKEISVEELGLVNGDTIEVSQEVKGGKPVIYLLPPAGTEIEAIVKLSLVPEWHLSAVYPVVPIYSLPSGGEMLQWDVRAFTDGTLREKATGLDVAYLFWEAEALVASAEDDDRKSLGVDNPFIPNKPKLDPLNSVVLEVANMTPYLDRALKALGLHIEARTSFITYWLPSFLKHKYIALQFLSQSVYERTAPLEVTPAPDIVVRVFMLFKGLKADDVAPGSGWGRVINSSKDDVEHWRNIVGIDEKRSLADGSLFRVIEWGGMEVPS